MTYFSFLRAPSYEHLSECLFKRLAELGWDGGGWQGGESGPPPEVLEKLMTLRIPELKRRAREGGASREAIEGAMASGTGPKAALARLAALHGAAAGGKHQPSPKPQRPSFSATMRTGSSQ